MSYDDEVFDASQEDTTSEYDLIPNAKYLLQATSVEVVEKDGGAKLMYKTEFEVVDGDYAGRNVFENFNIRNPSEEAVRIGRRQLAKLGKAISAPSFGVRDAQAANDALCWKPFIGKVGVQKDKSGNYGDQNRIKEYEPVNGAQESAPSAPSARANPSSARSTQNGGSAPTRQQPQQAPQRAAAGGGGRPWDRNR